MSKNNQKAKKKATEMIELRLPVSDTERPGYQDRMMSYINLNHMTTQQKSALRALFRGLREQNVELHSGKPVATQTDVVRYILEACHDAKESESALLQVRSRQDASTSCGGIESE